MRWYQEQAAFLQTCRKQLTPQEVGLPQGKRRHVAGLRREEVAALAGISFTWYTWLEQGHAISVSPATLERVVQVLHLSREEQAYLLALGEREQE